MTEQAQCDTPIKFGLKASDSEHAAIQKWRLNNPDGFILNMTSKTKGRLHGVDCDHFGDTSWEASAAGDLSKNIKYCSTDPDYLQVWAEESGIEAAYCSDCLEIVGEDEATDDSAPAECFVAPIATAEQFQAALLALRDKKKLTAEHLSILKHMASAPDKRTTATRMAKALNLATYAAASLRMGLFAHLLADELSYTRRRRAEADLCGGQPWLVASVAPPIRPTPTSISLCGPNWFRR